MIISQRELFWKFILFWKANFRQVSIFGEKALSLPKLLLCSPQNSDRESVMLTLTLTKKSEGRHFFADLIYIFLGNLLPTSPYLFYWSHKSIYCSTFLPVGEGEITRLTFCVSLTLQDQAGPLLQVLLHFLTSKSLFWCSLHWLYFLNILWILDFNSAFFCILYHLIVAFFLIFHYFTIFFLFYYHHFFFNYLIPPPPCSYFFFGFHWF